MNLRKLWPLGLLFGVLVVFAVAKGVRGRGATDIAHEAGVESLAGAPFAAADVARIELAIGSAPAPPPSGTPEEKKPDAKPAAVVLVRSGEGWTIESRYGAPADADKIKAFLDKVSGLEGELRSQDAAVLPDYGLGADQAVHLRLTGAGGKPLLHLLAGKRGKYNTSFVRRDGDNAVQEVNVNLRSEIGVFGDDAKDLPQTHWLDRAVAKLEKDRIRKIALKWPERSLVLEKRPVPEAKKEGEKKEEGKPPAPEPPPRMEWQAVEGTLGLEYKSSATEGLLGALARWDADDVLDPAQTAGFGLGDQAPYRCDVTLEDGRTVMLSGAVGPDDAGRVAAISTRDKVLYKLSSHQFERVFARGDQLFTGLPEPSIEKDKLKRVVTRDAGGERAFEKGADGKWKLAAPDTGHVLKDGAPDDVVSALTGLKPVDVVGEGDKAARGLEPGERTVTWTTDDGKSRAVKLGKTAKGAPGPYALLDPDKPLTTVVDKGAADRLFPEWTRLVEARLFPGLDAANIVEAAVKGTASDFTARKADGAWKIRTNEGEQDGKADTIDAWVKRLTELQAASLEPEAEPKDKVVAEILVKAGAGESVTLKLGDFKDGRRPAWRADRRLRFVVTDAASSFFTPDPATLKRPPPAPPTPAEPSKTEGDPKAAPAPQPPPPPSKPGEGGKQ